MSKLKKLNKLNKSKTLSAALAVGLVASNLVSVVPAFATNSPSSAVMSSSSTKATLNKTSITYDKKSGEDVVVTMTTNGIEFLKIKNGSHVLVAGTEYTLVDNVVTISKTYLKTLSTGTKTLTFDFASGTDPKLKITVQDTSSTLVTKSGKFDAAKPKDVTVTMKLQGNQLSAIKNGNKALTLGTDYTVSGSRATIKKEYMAKLLNGSTNLTFDFSAGTDPNFVLTVTHSTVAPDTTKPVIKLIGESTMNLTVGDVFTDPGSTVTDNVDTDLVAVVTGAVDMTKAGTYLLRYNVSDTAGNAAAEVVRTVVVAESQVTVESVNATNGLVTVKLNRTPTTTPVLADFAVTQSIDGAAATNVTPSEFTMNGAEATMKVAPVVATTADQSVVYSVSYKGRTAKTSTAFVVPKVLELAITSVNATISKTTVVVNFNKALDSDLNLKDKFAIAGATIKTATLSADKKAVTLDVSGLDYSTTYTVSATNILVDGKQVTPNSMAFTTVAVTDVYDLVLKTNATNDTITANGADNLVVTAELQDKVTHLVDTNANDLVLAFSSTYGSLANTRVTVQKGVATVTLTSEFSQVDLVSKVDAQIIEASGDYKPLIGKIVGTKNITFKVQSGDVNPDQRPVIVSAESNQADRVTLYFNKAVSVSDFVQYDTANKKFKVDGAGNAILISGTSIVVKQADGVAHIIRGLKPVANNPKAMEVVLDWNNTLNDNARVDVSIAQPSNIGVQTSNASFILTDARKPEATAAVAPDLKTVVVTFSEPTAYAIAAIDGGQIAVDRQAGDTGFGNFDQATLTDTRDTLTLRLQDYLKAGTHSVQLANIMDFAGRTDPNNISTSQSLDFTVLADPSVPTATVSVESPEQLRVNFNKIVTGFDVPGAAAKATLQVLVKGTGGVADAWVAVTDPSLAAYYANVPAFDVTTKVSGSEYVLETDMDWTKVYNTTATNKNYYNDQYRLVIAKDTVQNPANGNKNAEIILPLDFSGSLLNKPDTTSPTIDKFEKTTAIDHFNVKMSEPVKLPAQDNAGDTVSQIQNTEIPTPIIEFIGKDKNGTTVTIKGQVIGYSDIPSLDPNAVDPYYADRKFQVMPAVGQPSLQDIVDNGGSTSWQLVVRAISDDVGNTASSLTYDFQVAKSGVQAEVFMVKGEWPDLNHTLYNGVSGYLNGAGKDTVVLDFTADIQYTGDVKNAINPSNYLINGVKLPNGSILTVADSSPLVPGVDIVVITLPDGTLIPNASNVITLSKALKSSNEVALTGDYEITFTGVDNLVVNKAVLTSAIADATALRDGAVEGTAIGNYPHAAIVTYSAAIAAAVTANQSATTQAEVDAAVATLATATNAFKASVIANLQVSALSATIGGTTVAAVDQTGGVWAVDLTGNLLADELKSLTISANINSSATITLTSFFPMPMTTPLTFVNGTATVDVSAAHLKLSSFKNRNITSFNATITDADGHTTSMIVNLNLPLA